MYSNVTSQGSSSRNDQVGDAPRYLQRFFLARLHHMVALRAERGPLLKLGNPDLRLLDKAVYSTFCDCLDLGAAEEARAILRHEEIDLGGSDTPEIEPN